eukprot:CAMPEP_0198731086 /NCGR_PEP_ID=MMETSP1475-20131203/28041_1 /TAXON_ID= ORGANISM="Unidentified sp., Strain CCMP1999" /NCGR_SAMPLE_ID=MMETSP1475 /ASSEMBLY_ACC=CAM_ASM_001111 /LENGTH=751 /DNA_ID=CAMNT_0044493997 /DNA_START=137 /DNA_END=2392 /DNA_ORIENTATION=-
MASTEVQGTCDEAFPTENVVTPIADTYKKLLRRSADCSRAYLEEQGDNGVLIAQTLWAQRDPYLGKLRKYARTFTLSSNESGLSILGKSPAVETSCMEEIVMNSSSNEQDENSKSKGDSSNNVIVRFFEDYLELWRNGLLQHVTLTKAIHGDVFVDGNFGCYAIAGERVFYTAAPVKKAPAPTKPAAAQILEEGKTGEFAFVEDFGEKYPKKSNPRLFVVDTASGEVKKAEGLPDQDVKDVTINQEMDLICVALRGRGLRDTNTEDEPPLGMYYCFNRPGRAYVAKFSEFRDGKCTWQPLSDPEDGDFNVHCLRFVPKSRDVMYVSSPKVRSHNMTMALRKASVGIDGQTSKRTTVLDIPRGELSSEEFPGLYIGLKKPLSLDPFVTSDGRYLILETTWGSYNKCLVVDCSQKNKVFPLVPPSEGSMMLKGSLRDVLLVSISSFSTPPALYAAKLDTNDPSKVDYKLLASSAFAEESSPPVVSWSVHTLPNSCEAIYVKAEKADGDCKRPLLCFPHGGPHSANVVAYSVLVELLAWRGISVLMVNFRGSTGRGEDFLQALPGKCGTMDVNDCIEAVEWAIEQGEVLAEKVGVIGGSHGGFLSAHLTAQRPDLFKVAVMRNPVVNLVTMTGGTEIPDWCYYESGLGQGSTEVGSWPPVPGPEELKAMFDVSPVRYVKNVKAPTLLQVGEKDLRVPPQQSREWMRALRRQGTIVRMLSYPNSDHSIDNAPAFDDAQIQLVSWVDYHLLQTGQK